MKSIYCIMIGLAASLATAAEPATCPIQTTPLNAITVDSVPGNRTPDDLVRAMVGAGVTFSNVQFRGVISSAGTFTNAGTISGFEDGVILSSGNIENVIGPNQSEWIAQGNGLPGDPDLARLTFGFTTFDATVLEFDFVPVADVISFQYVFASDE